MSTEQRSDPPAFTPLWEQRLIGAAKRGDRVAEAQLLDLYEPMVRRITGSLYLPGGEREDLAQEARPRLRGTSGASPAPGEHEPHAEQMGDRRCCACSSDPSMSCLPRATSSRTRHVFSSR